MTEQQKQYIEKNIHLIEDSDWEKFFSQAPHGTGLLLYEAGVNFLKDVSEILLRMFNYSDLTELVIPNNITSIGNSVFICCKSLTSIALPNSVTTIESNAFQACSKLTSITIPNSVTSIGSYAFSYCDSLTKAVVNNPVATFGSCVFDSVSSNFELHGYKGSTAETYAKANGHKFVAID